MNIDKVTNSNIDYRRVIQTTDQMQLVLMSIGPGDFIKNEVHPNTTQFVKVEGGSGFSVIDGKKCEISEGSSMMIPPGTTHYFKTPCNKTCPMKIYVIYSPPEHPDGLVQPFNPYSLDLTNFD